MIRDTKFAYIAVALFVAMILLSLLGERILPLFGGNRELAARIYKVIFILLGTGVVIFVTPFLVSNFVERARFVIAAGGSKSDFATILLGNNIPHIAHIVGYSLMGVFAFGGVIATIMILIE